MKTRIPTSELQTGPRFFTNYARITAFLLVFFLTLSAAPAQPQLKLWSVADNAIDFPSGPSASGMLHYDYTGTAPKFSQNALYDAAGNLLFFVVDGTVYDREGYLIDEIYGLYDPGGFQTNIYRLTGMSEWVIVPVPNECRRYYLICNQIIQTAGSRIRRGSGTYYIVLDMQAENVYYSGRKGALEMNPDWGMPLATNIVDFYTGPARECYAYHLAVTKRRPADDNHLLFVNDCSNFFRFRIEQSGIYDDSYTHPLTSTDAGWIRSESEIVELSDGTYRLAIPLTGGGLLWPRLEIFHLDAGGNVLSSYWVQTASTFGSSYQGLRGLEFSPDGNTLYFTHNQAPHVRYIDVGSNSTAMVGLSQVSNPADFQYSQIETGHDGKLYFAAANRLGCLADANNPASAWTNNALSITVPLSTGQWGDENEKLRILPDQMDGENYDTHLFETSECCELAQKYTVDEYTVSASASWTPGPANNPFWSPGTITVRNRLTIPAGVQLTITGMVVKMGPGARIIIERGNGSAPAARLTLNNTTITANDACGTSTMWRGIVLEGDRTAPQNFASQGYLQMINGSVLEHAYDAVVVKGIHPDGSTDWNKTGGIIHASDSYFLNNRRAVEFMSYGNTGNINSISRFDRCVFETNQLLRDQDAFPGNANIWAFVTLWDIDGVRFRDNIFRNTFMDALSGDPAGYGIISAEALYHVQRGTYTGASGNRFENLVKGIQISRSAAMTSGTQYINDNTFTDCRYGIQIVGDGSGYDIRRNSFTKSTLPAATLYSPALGIYTEGAQRLYIVENNFENFTYGVLIKNSGGADDWTSSVYGNTFLNCFRSLQTQYSNLRLRVKCNEFHDSAAVAQMFWGNWGPMADQGGCASISDPAGNRFFGMPTHKQIYAQPTYPFSYSHHNGLVPIFIVPVMYYGSNPSLTPCGAYNWDQNAACDNVFHDVVHKPALPLLISELIYKAEYQRARSLLKEGTANGTLAQTYGEYFNLLLNILEHKRSIAEMNREEFETLERIARGHDGASANARALLSYFAAREFPPETLEVEEQTTDVPETNPAGSAALGYSYPNPADTETRISYEVRGTKAQVLLCDLFGRTVLQQEVQPGKGEIRLPVQNLNNGLYVCRLMVDAREAASRMITVRR